MNFATVVFIVIVAFFVWRGYEKGFIGSITRILSWIFAYPAAIFFTKPLAKILLQQTPLNGVLVYLVAGCSIFLVVSVTVTLLLNALSAAIPANQFTENSSKYGGATVGLLMGCVVGLLVVYLIDIVVKTPQAEVAATEPSSQSIIENAYKKVPANKPTNDSFLETNAKNLVSKVATTAINATIDDSTTTQMTKAFIQDPQTMLSHVQQVTNNGEIKALLDQPEFQAQLNSGDVNALMSNQDFQKLMNNQDMHALVSSVDGGTEGATGEKAAAEKMITAWRKIESLKNDPRVTEIVSDPEFQQQMSSANKFPLMMNPKLKQLMDIIFSNQPYEPAASQTQASKHITNYQIEDITDGVPQQNYDEQPKETKRKVKQEEQTEQKLYKWTDENGRVHFSDKPIKNKPEQNN